MSKKKAPLQHYLVSIPLTGGYMHGYVMTNDERDLFGVHDRLMQEIEKHGYQCRLQMILQTHLDTGWDIVREIIKSRNPEAGKLWATAKTFHITAWIMPESDPDTKRLMELH